MSDKDEFSSDGVDTDDEFDFDALDDLGMDEMDDGFGDADTKGREPVSPVSLSYVAKNAVSPQTAGMIGSKIGEEFTGIGDIYDSTTSVVSDVSRMKDDMLKEIAPSVTAAKRVGRLYLPKVEGILPKKLYEKLDGIITEKEEYQSQSEESARESVVASQLADVFGAQADIDQEQRVEDKVDTIVDRKLAGSRHVESTTVLSQIRNILKSNQLFYSGVFRKYLMKSLELKYKHVYIASDTLASVRKLYDLTDRRYEELVYNTSLPDIVKKRTSEAIKEQMRGRFMQNRMDDLGSITGDYGKKVMTNLKDNVFSKGADMFNQVVGGTADVLEGSHDMESMEDGPKQSMLTKLLSTIVNKTLVETGLVATKAAVGGQKFEDMNEIAKTVKGNAAIKINDAVDNMEDGGVKSFLRTFLPEIDAERGTISNAYNDAATEDIGYDIASRKSLTEIIPGFLSKIERSTDIIQNVVSFSAGKGAGKATKSLIAGFADRDELVFDKKSEDFISSSEYVSKIEKDFFGDDDAQREKLENTVSILKAGYDKHGGDVSEFNEALPKTIRVINNIAKHARDVKPGRILKYLNGEELTAPEEAYLDLIFMDLSDTEREQVAEILVKSFFKPAELQDTDAPEGAFEDPGETEEVVDNDITASFTNFVGSLGRDRDEFLKKVSTFEEHGQKRYFDKLITNQSDKAKSSIEERIKNKYIQKHTLEKLNKDEDLQKQMYAEIEQAQGEKGLSHSYLRDKFADVDVDRLADDTDSTSANIVEELKARDKRRDVESQGDYLSRAGDAVSDLAKEKVIDPIKKHGARLAPVADKVKDTRLGKFVFKGKDTEDAVDDIGDDTEVPTRDAVQISGPGIYYQGVDRELHMPLDDGDDVKLKEALDTSNIADERKRAEMIKRALKEFIASKGVNLNKKDIVDDLDSAEEDANLTDIIDPVEDAKNKAAKIRELLKKENVATSKRRFMYQGKDEWSYPDAPDAPKTKDTEVLDEIRAYDEDEGLIGGDDTIGLMSAKSKPEIDALRKKSKIPHRDSAQISGPGTYLQGLAKELHIPLVKDKDGNIDIVASSQVVLDSLPGDISGTVDKTMMDAEWKLMEGKQAFNRGKSKVLNDARVQSGKQYFDESISDARDIASQVSGRVVDELSKRDLDTVDGVKLAAETKLMESKQAATRVKSRVLNDDRIQSGKQYLDESITDAKDLASQVSGRVVDELSKRDLDTVDGVKLAAEAKLMEGKQAATRVKSNVLNDERVIAGKQYLDESISEAKDLAGKASDRVIGELSKRDLDTVDGVKLAAEAKLMEGKQAATRVKSKVLNDARVQSGKQYFDESISEARDIASQVSGRVANELSKRDLDSVDGVKLAAETKLMEGKQAANRVKSRVLNDDRVQISKQYIDESVTDAKDLAGKASDRVIGELSKRDLDSVDGVKLAAETKLMEGKQAATRFRNKYDVDGKLDTAKDMVMEGYDKSQEIVANLANRLRELDLDFMPKMGGSSNVASNVTVDGEAADILTNIRDILAEHAETVSDGILIKQSTDAQIIQLLSSQYALSSGDPEAMKKTSFMSKVLGLPKVAGKGALGYVKWMGGLHKRIIKGTFGGIKKSIKKLFENNRIVRGTKYLWNKGKDVAGLAKKGASAMWGLQKGAAKMGWKGIKATAGFGAGQVKDIFTTRFIDVYRKDDVKPGSPLVKGADIKDGKIMFEDGKLVKDSYSIKAPCFDGKTQKLLISQDDIDTGLVNVKNKPIKTKLLRKALGLAWKGIKGIGKLTKKSAELSLSASKWAAGKVLDGASHVPGLKKLIPGRDKTDKVKIGSKEATAINSKSIETLVTKHLLRIIKLLEPISDKVTGKVREGGFKDYVADKAAAKKSRGGLLGRKGRSKKGRKRRGRKGGLLAKAAGEGEGSFLGDMASSAGGFLAARGGAALMSGGIGTAVTGAASTAMAATTAAASAVGTGVMGTAAFLATNPVGWAILGTIAVGTAAYGVHKWLKGKKKKLAMLRIRNKGYKVPEGKLKTLLKFEEEYYETKVDNQEMSEDTLKDYADDFGLDTDNPAVMSFFRNWYDTTFKGVFKESLNLLINVFSKDYDDQTDLDEGQMKEYTAMLEKSPAFKTAVSSGVALSPAGFLAYNKEKTGESDPKKSKVKKAITKTLGESKIGKLVAASAPTIIPSDPKKSKVKKVITKTLGESKMGKLVATSGIAAGPLTDKGKTLTGTSGTTKPSLLGDSVKGALYGATPLGMVAKGGSWLKDKLVGDPDDPETEDSAKSSLLGDSVKGALYGATPLGMMAKGGSWLKDRLAGDPETEASAKTSPLMAGMKGALYGATPLGMIAKGGSWLKDKLADDPDDPENDGKTSPLMAGMKGALYGATPLGMMAKGGSWLKDKLAGDPEAGSKNITKNIDAKSMAPVDAKKLQLMQTQIDMLSQIYTAINNINSVKDSGSVDVAPMSEKLEEMISILRAQTDAPPPRKKQSTPKEVTPPASGTGISVAKIPITSTTF